MGRWFVILFALMQNYWQADCNDNKYDDYTLLKVYPYNLDQLIALTELRSDPYEGVEVLKRSHRMNDSTDILVSPDNMLDMLVFADTFGMPVEFKYNYGRFIERFSPIQRSYDVYAYNSYDSILKHINDLAKQMPDILTIQDMGNSYEGRKIVLVKISTNPGGRNPVMLIEAGMHGREWVGISMALYLIDYFVIKPDSMFLDGVDWHILPVANPDGYEYSRSKRSRRLWRKTRSKTGVVYCEGVDGNRNFDYMWGTVGASKDPCDTEAYCGPRAFSEPETRIVQIALLENAKRIKMYVAMHTYGNYLMFPWAHTDEHWPDKGRRLRNLAFMASDVVQSVGGAPFEVMSIGDWRASSGTSADYAYGTVEIPYVYSMELTEGFEYTFPSELLSTVLPQYLAAFKIFSIQIKREFEGKIF